MVIQLRPITCDDRRRAARYVHHVRHGDVLSIRQTVTDPDGEVRAHMTTVAVASDDWDVRTYAVQRYWDAGSPIDPPPGLTVTTCGLCKAERIVQSPVPMYPLADCGY